MSDSPIGEPGVYDEACTVAREVCRAQGVLLIVADGHSGNGFSVQAPLHLMLRIPQVLRHVADQIEAQTKEAKAN